MHGIQLILVRTGSVICALPAASVVETMRPLPLTPFAGQPPFVRGISVIRGAATPVVDLGALVSGDHAAPVARFVTVRTGERSVALAVEAVLGLTQLDTSAMDHLPRLLRRVGEATVSTLGTLDGSLLAVLDAARLVPEEVWRAFESAVS
jgi:purine-binding chemotaxis protein CheW